MQENDGSTRPPRGHRGSEGVLAAHMLAYASPRCSVTYVGAVQITDAYCLPASRVLHTVGPIFRGELQPSALQSCYTSCLDLAKQRGVRSVAFCSISTGPAAGSRKVFARVLMSCLPTQVCLGTRKFPRLRRLSKRCLRGWRTPPTVMRWTWWSSMCFLIDCGRCTRKCWQEQARRHRRPSEGVHSCCLLPSYHCKSHPADRLHQHTPSKHSMCARGNIQYTQRRSSEFLPLQHNQRSDASLDEKPPPEIRVAQSRSSETLVYINNHTAVLSR